jgi:proteasome alpha subunit
MTEEPYRWLEAIANRREYIREQMRGGTPVFAVSCPEGVVLVGAGIGRSKVFEIYDRHAYAALGHPVDIEKLRQAAIEAAHLEGFNRSPQDVTLRRLISFALSATLKASFEQIFSPPFIVESIWAELGDTPERDVLVRMQYDGHHRYDNGPVVVAHVEPRREEEASAWLRSRLQAGQTSVQIAGLCLVAWQALMDGRPFDDLSAPVPLPARLEGRTVEAALLDRGRAGPVHYRELALS